MNDHLRITTGFNVVMICLCILQGIFRFAFSGKAQGVKLEGLVVTSIVSLIPAAIATCIAVYFVREFWNRFVTTVFGLRNVDTNESIALVLLPTMWIG